ncbi:MAG: hypothetical protein WHS87_01835 [Anaerolineales bacterium]
MFNPSLAFPAFILALLLAVIGLWRKNFWFILVAVFLSIPISFYLQTNSDLRQLAWLIPLSLFLSAYSVKTGRNRLGLVLFLPSVLFAIMLLVAVIAWLNIRG